MLVWTLFFCWQGVVFSAGSALPRHPLFSAYFPHLLLPSVLTLWAPVVLKVVLVKVPPSGSAPCSCARYPTIYTPHNCYYLLLFYPTLLAPLHQHSSSNCSLFSLVPASFQTPAFSPQPHRGTPLFLVVISSTFPTLSLLYLPYLLRFCPPWPCHSIWTVP